VSVSGKNSMTRGSAFISAKGSRSESFHRRSMSRSVSSIDSSNYNSELTNLKP
jgi:hypothetical protein